MGGMNEAKIRELAEAAFGWSKLVDVFEFAEDELIAFAQLVAKAEREACIAICENMRADEKRCQELQLTEQAWEEGQESCAHALRNAG